MGKITWKLYKLPKNLVNSVRFRCRYGQICFKSLTYNKHMSMVYATEVLMEPLYWIVDNYTHLLGPFFVVGVSLLTAAVVFISYWIGLPFWWAKSKGATIGLLIAGNWLLMNVIFHYVMAVITPPGQPPQNVQWDAVAMCKKCISPKPPRTHHCSVCNKCILKMDHHCPWINNCVGFGNHRYFYLYMVYTTLGCLFLVVFGIEIGYKYLWLEQEEHWVETEPLEGHLVTVNLTGHLIPVTHLNEYDDDLLLPAKHTLPLPVAVESSLYNLIRRRALMFVALITLAVVLALGSLTIWHGKLITRGETSIEVHINKSEYLRLLAERKEFINPYNFGRKKNWRFFLGLVRGRSFWRTVLLPSWHKPDGNGMRFHTVYDEWALRTQEP